MDRTPVKSSQVVSIGHDGEALEIEFKGGSVYRYPAPEEIYRKLLAADADPEQSVGKAFNALVKTAKDEDGNLRYPHMRIGDLK